MRKQFMHKKYVMLLSEANLVKMMMNNCELFLNAQVAQSQIEHAL